MQKERPMKVSHTTTIDIIVKGENMNSKLFQSMNKKVFITLLLSMFLVSADAFSQRGNGQGNGNGQARSGNNDGGGKRSGGTRRGGNRGGGVTTTTTTTTKPVVIVTTTTRAKKCQLQRFAGGQGLYCPNQNPSWKKVVCNDGRKPQDPRICASQPVNKCKGITAPNTRTQITKYSKKKSMNCSKDSKTVTAACKYIEKNNAYELRFSDSKAYPFLKCKAACVQTNFHRGSGLYCEGMLPSWRNVVCTDGRQVNNPNICAKPAANKCKGITAPNTRTQITKYAKKKAKNCSKHAKQVTAACKYIEKNNAYELRFSSTATHPFMTCVADQPQGNTVEIVQDMNLDIILKDGQALSVEKTLKLIRGNALKNNEKISKVTVQAHMLGGTSGSINLLQNSKLTYSSGARSVRYFSKSIDLLADMSFMTRSHQVQAINSIVITGMKVEIIKLGASSGNQNTGSNGRRGNGRRSGGKRAGSQQ